ncbi:hypothetical protein [Brachybacterium subflavum]|uniref:hypothetical protein n=1 Tax=Brachybacterium subflavum TaxID=2585206 RepID=UPI00187AC5B1|nr:hypothetical protein [Brachybacterium subflavum]
MSSTLTPPPPAPPGASGPSGPSDPSGPSAASPSPQDGAADDAARPLAADEPRRPRDFGLDVRLLRRIRLVAFAILAIPLLILALLAVRFVSMPLTQAWHGGAYGDGKYAQASERLWPVQKANWFEPYLPHLTRGTDLLQQDQNAEAETELRLALKDWQEGKDLNQPPHAQCKILNNLAISIERQANEIDDAGDRADRLYEAEQLLAPCAGGGGGGDGEGQGGGGQGEDQQGEGSGNEDEGTTGDNGKRIEDERRSSDEEAGNDPDARDEGQDGDDQGQGEDQGDQDGNGSAPKDPGDPKKEDPKGDGPDEEAPTQGNAEDQKKAEDLEKRNGDANSGDGEDSDDGASSDPSQPW